MDAPSDLHLVRLAALGDTSSFNELYRRFHKKLMKHLVWYCGNEADAADAAQNAYLAMLEKPPTGDSVYAWVCTTARNALGLERRRISWRRPHDEHAVPHVPELYMGTSQSLPPDVILARRERLRAVAKALEGATEDQVQALEMVEVDGLTEREAAKKLGVSPSAVHKRLERVRNAIAKLVERELGYKPQALPVAFRMDLDKMQKMRDDGFTDIEIAERLGLHRCTVRRKLGNQPKRRKREQEQS